MAYSKAYQTVIAGRVREDELGFFKTNVSAYPTGTKSINNVGGKKQPTIDIERMNDDEMGKRRSTVTHAVKSAYNPVSTNIG